MLQREQNPSTLKRSFFLSACSLEALNFTIRSCSLKIRHGDNLKAPGLALSRCKSTAFWMEISKLKNRWAWVDTSSRDISGWQLPRQKICMCSYTSEKKVSWTTALHVKTMDGQTTTSSRAFFQICFYPILWRDRLLHW